MHMSTQVLLRLGIKGSLLLTDNSSDYWNFILQSISLYIKFQGKFYEFNCITAVSLFRLLLLWPFHKKWLELIASYVVGSPDMQLFYLEKIILYLRTSDFNRVFQVSLLSNSMTFFQKDQWNAIFRKIECSSMADLGPSTWQILIGLELGCRILAIFLRLCANYVAEPELELKTFCLQNLSQSCGNANLFESWAQFWKISSS